MTKILTINPWTGKSIDDVVHALKSGVCRIDKFLVVVELCEDGRERNIGCIVNESTDEVINPVDEVLSREVKPDGRISGLGKHVGKTVKVVVPDQGGEVAT